VSHGIVESTASVVPVTLRLQPVLELTDEQFFELCQINRELRLERTAEGDLLIRTPTGWETGARNAEISRQLGNWAKEDGSGVATDSSTGYKLPNGAERAPDAAGHRTRYGFGAGRSCFEILSAIEPMTVTTS
jgi:Uma2 family endonuclease